MGPKRLEVFRNLFPTKNPFQYQIDWVEDRSNYKLAVKARQIGITFTTAVDEFITALSWKESESSPHAPTIVFASPSQRQSNRLMDYFREIRLRFQKVYNRQIVFRKETEQRMIFPSGASIFSLPNNPYTVEGIDASKCIIDEVGNFQKNDGENMYQSMMGSLAAKGGSMAIFGKPRGRRGVFWKLFDPYGEFSSKFSIHSFPYKVRADVDMRYRTSVAEQKERMTKMEFASNYLCEFTEEDVLLFTYDLLDQQRRKYDLWTLERFNKSGLPLYGGIDFAKKRSQTAVTFVEHGDKETRVVFHEVTQIPFDKQVLWFIDLIKKFNPVKVLVDETGLGQPLLDTLQSHFATRVEGVIFTEKTKEKMALNCKNLFEEKKLIIPDNDDLIDQLHGIEKEVLESGRVRYTGKRTETDWLDDRAWSLFLACSQLSEGEWSFTVADTQTIKQVSPDEAFRRDTDEWGNPL